MSIRLRLLRGEEATMRGIGQVRGPKPRNLV